MKHNKIWYFFFWRRIKKYHKVTKNRWYIVKLSKYTFCVYRRHPILDKHLISEASASDAKNFIYELILKAHKALREITV